MSAPSPARPVPVPEPPAGTAAGSPCISVCRMDQRSGLCQGCHRTLEEIAAWSTMDDAARRAVWAKLAARRAGAAGPEAQGAR